MITKPAFTVGVTGHINLPQESLDSVIESIKQVFQWLKQTPVKGELNAIFGPPLGLRETPIVLLSPLAPGADQLGARAALDLGIQVKCPLPFPIEVYRRSTTFRDASGELVATRLAAFDSLTREVGMDHVFLVRHADDVGRFEEERDWPIEDTEFRNLRYRATGEFVARHCDLLIAICNQEKRSDVSDRDSRLSSLAESGSRVITASYLNGLRPGILPLPVSLSWQECGPLVRIYCPNSKEPQKKPPLEPGSMAIWHPDDPGDDEKVSRRIHQREMADLRTQVGNLEKINRELRRASRQSEKNLATVDDPVALIERAQQEIDRQARHHTAIAANFTRLSYLAGLILFLSVSMVERGRAGYLLIIAGISILAILTQTLIRTRFNFYRKSEDYRALAGALEVQGFWARSGIQESVAFHYLQRLRGDISWILRALDSMILPCEKLSSAFWNCRTDREKLGVLREVWADWVMADQKKHALLAYQKTRSKLIFNFLGYGFLTAGAAVMILVMGLYWPVTRGAIDEALVSSGFTQWKTWLGVAFFILILMYSGDRRISHHLQDRRIAFTLLPDLLLFRIFRSVWARVLFGLAVGFFSYSCIYVETDPSFPNQLSAGHQKWVGWSKSLFFALGGLWIGYAVTTFVKEDAKRHADMRGMFDAAKRKLDFMLNQYENMIESGKPPGDLAQMVASIQAMFKTLGCEVLHEQAECLLVRRGRPVKALANIRN